MSRTNIRIPMQVRRARLMAFAPPQAAPAARPDPQLEIASLRDYRLREPVSGRSYTVLRLQTRGGLEGYGECGEVNPRDLTGVLEAVRGKEATQFATVRYQLRNAPAGLMAALNMAMLDVVGRSVKAPAYRFWGVRRGTSAAHWRRSKARPIRSWHSR